jgi:hypothetical protein
MAIRLLVAMSPWVSCAAISGCGRAADSKTETKRVAAEGAADAGKKPLADKETADKASAGKKRQNAPDSIPEAARRACGLYLNAARKDFQGNDVQGLLTEAFWERLRGLRGPEIPFPYEYDRWEITREEAALDGGAVVFRGTVRVTVWRKYDDIGPGGRAWQNFPSGGQAEFSLRLAKARDGVWGVDDFRFAKRSARQIVPAEPTPEEVREAVSAILHFPRVIRGDLAPRQLADELKTKVWAFAYTGGPLQCRVAVEEVGQKTYGGERHFSIPDDYLKFGESEGHVCLWMRQVLSERMKQIALKAGKVGDTQGVVVGNYNPSHRATASASFPFLWFHWQGASFMERKFEAVPKDGAEVTILEVEATGLQPPEGKSPRKVKLTMTAKPLAPM